MGRSTRREGVKQSPVEGVGGTSLDSCWTGYGGRGGGIEYNSDGTGNGVEERQGDSDVTDQHMSCV